MIEPEDAAGNIGRPSAIFCRVACADPELPWGDIVINDGAPRTSNPLLDLTLSVYNKNPAEVSVRFGIDTPPQGNGIPFSTSHMLSLPAVSEPTEMTVSVGFFPSSLGRAVPLELREPGRVLIFAIAAARRRLIADEGLGGHRSNRESNRRSLSVAAPRERQDRCWPEARKDGTALGQGRISPFRQVTLIEYRASA